MNSANNPSLSLRVYINLDILYSAQEGMVMQDMDAHDLPLKPPPELQDCIHLATVRNMHAS